MLARLFVLVVAAALGWSLIVPFAPLIQQGLAALAVLGVVCIAIGLVLRPLFRWFYY
jgi:hypothetical protein